MTRQTYTTRFDGPERNTEKPVPESAGRPGNQYGAGMTGRNPASLEHVTRGIMTNHHPAGFMDSINAAQGAIGNRNFMQFVDGVQQRSRPPDAHSIAAQGMQGPGRSLTHLDAIQQAFGHHKVSAMREYTGQEARASLDTLGAAGYSSKGRMAFSDTPDLYSQAHEAAHGVQQAALGDGLRLKGGIGEEGDRYERHADAVAQAVVKGESAEPLLDRVAGGPTKVTPVSGGGNGPVQMMWPDLARHRLPALMSMFALRSGGESRIRPGPGRNLLLNPRRHVWNKDILFGANYLDTLYLAIKQEAATDSAISRSLFKNLGRDFPANFPVSHLWDRSAFGFANRDQLMRRDRPYMDYVREAIVSAMARRGNLYWALGHLDFNNVFSDLFRIQDEYGQDPVKYMAEVSYPDLMDKHGKYIDASTREDVKRPQLDIMGASPGELEAFEEFHRLVEQGRIVNVTPFQPLITTAEIIGFLLGDERKFLDRTIFFDMYHQKADQENFLSAFFNVLDQLLDRRAEMGAENDYKLERPVYRPLDRYSAYPCGHCDAVFKFNRELEEHWNNFPAHRT